MKNKSKNIWDGKQKKMLSQIENEMESCYFDKVPNVIGIIDSTMSQEHKTILVAKVHNYQNEKTSREFMVKSWTT